VIPNIVVVIFHLETVVVFIYIFVSSFHPLMFRMAGDDGVCCHYWTCMWKGRNDIEDNFNLERSTLCSDRHFSSAGKREKISRNTKTHHQIKLYFSISPLSILEPYIYPWKYLHCIQQIALAS
jgi:hypothetical protein